MPLPQAPTKNDVRIGAVMLRFVQDGFEGTAPEVACGSPDREDSRLLEEVMAFAKPCHRRGVAKPVHDYPEDVALQLVLRLRQAEAVAPTELLRVDLVRAQVDQVPSPLWGVRHRRTVPHHEVIVRGLQLLGQHEVGGLLGQAFVHAGRQDFFQRQGVLHVQPMVERRREKPVVIHVALVTHPFEPPDACVPYGLRHILEVRKAIGQLLVSRLRFLVTPGVLDEFSEGWANAGIL